MMKTNNPRPKISIAIPTSKMKNGDFFIRRCIGSIVNQTFHSWEIVITDNSDDNTIENVCLDFLGYPINYYRNPIKGMAVNTNEAIRRSSGEIIKVLYMDDYLKNDRVLEEILDNFDKNRYWLICGADNNPNPQWTDDIIEGNNRLGSPSALAIRRSVVEDSNPIFFDEHLTWLLDVLYYFRLKERYGEPVILAGSHIGIGVGDHQMTFLIPQERKLWEHNYVNLLKKKPNV